MSAAEVMAEAREQLQDIDNNAALYQVTIH